jgi:glycosyltransferase involved in cell wall biosynthesis
MRVVLDGTPLLGRRTGVGRYTAHLLAQLVALPELEVAATAFTWRGLDELAATLPAGVARVARRAPARLLQKAWTRSDLPPVEWLAGPADVVHATNFVLPPLRRARGVLTIHDLSYLRTPDTVTSASARYTDLVPRGLRRAAAVLTPSRAVADEVVAAYRLDPQTVQPTPLGVDDEWFDATPPPPDWLAARGLPERYLIFVGSAEPRKNLPVLLAALRGLHGTYPDCPPLVLVGPPGWGPALDPAGPPGGAVHGLPNEATPGLPEGAVVVAGYLDDADLRRVVAGAAVLCFPSRYEGFGLPPLEALAAGTPVVASDLPAVREVTADVAGKAVRLVPPGDPDALADALLAVLDGGAGDPAAGRAHARGFTWRRTAELTAAAYRQAVAG